MNHNEEPDIQGEYTDKPLPDELFHVPLNNKSDHTEAYQYQYESSPSEENDSTAVAGVYGEATPAENDDTASSIDELEALYGVIDEDLSGGADYLTIDNGMETGGTQDSASLMAEIEQLFTDPADLETEDNIIEETSDAASIMEELEALFNHSTVSSDTVTLSETSEHTLDEDDAGSLSALDELRTFLGEASQPETSEADSVLIDTVSLEVPDNSVISRRPVLDELRNLLQSCIDELITVSDTSVSETALLADTEYPSRVELQGLLEGMLAQLTSAPYAPADMDITGNDSLLDDLRDFMHVAASAEVECDTTDADASGSPDLSDRREEMSLMEKGSTLDDLAGYLAELSGESEDSDEPLTDAMTADSEYIEDMLSEGYGSADVFAEDITYADEVSNSIDDYSVNYDAGSTDEELPSSAGALEELQLILDEISTSDKNNASKDNRIDEDGDISWHETGLFANDADVIAAEAKSDSKKAGASDTGIVSIHETADAVNASNGPAGNGSQLWLGMFITAVLVAGVYTLWGRLSVDDSMDRRSATVPVIRLSDQVREHESADISERLLPTTDYRRRNGYLQQPVRGEREENRAATAVQAQSDTASEYELMNETGSIGFGPKDKYGAETLNIRSADRSEPTKDVPLITLQQQNSENLEDINKRLSDAEVSIAILQKENNRTSDQKEIDELVPKVPADEFVKRQTSVLTKSSEQEAHVDISIASDTGKWAVHLSSYYGKPPSASELEYFDKAGISYRIKKAIINEKVWYRVLVDNFSDYEQARLYSARIGPSLSRKDIWINRNK